MRALLQPLPPLLALLDADAVGGGSGPNTSPTAGAGEGGAGGRVRVLGVHVRMGYLLLEPTIHLNLNEQAGIADFDARAEAFEKTEGGEADGASRALVSISEEGALAQVR
jgi:hypothetical protein